MNTIQKLLAVGLLAVSSVGFASSVAISTVGGVGDINLIGTNDTVNFSGNFADTGSPNSVFYGLTVSADAGAVAAARSVVFPGPTFGDVLLEIFTDDDMTAGFTMGDSLVVSGINALSNFTLMSGIQYFLQLTGPSNTGYSGSISTVPVPAAGILFASALFGAGFLGRRKKKASKTVMMGTFARAS